MERVDWIRTFAGRYLRCISKYCIINRSTANGQSSASKKNNENAHIYNFFDGSGKMHKEFYIDQMHASGAQFFQAWFIEFRHNLHKPGRFVSLSCFWVLLFLLCILMTVTIVAIQFFYHMRHFRTWMKWRIARRRFVWRRTSTTCWTVVFHEFEMQMRTPNEFCLLSNFTKMKHRTEQRQATKNPEELEDCFNVWKISNESTDSSIFRQIAKITWMSNVSTPVRKFREQQLNTYLSNYDI